jgi:Tol biopolymer transport system component
LQDAEHAGAWEVSDKSTTRPRGGPFVQPAARGIGNAPEYLPDRDVTTEAEEPSFSPEGAWVAYESNAPEAETFDLWLVRADGSDNHRLTSTPLVSEAHPRFSVNGGWIYYIASQADGAWNLWRIRPDGTHSSKLTNYVAGQALVATIAVGRDKVVFATQGFGPLQSVALDGSGQQAIPGTDGASDPALDPTGKRLLLVLQTVVGNPEVYSMKLDGTGLTNLTADSPAADTQPIWSPDGNTIAFVGGRAQVPGGSTTWDVYTMATSGAAVQRVTYTQGATDVAWQPSR